MHELKQIPREKAILSLNLAINYSRARIDDYLRKLNK